jgi:Holliday junction resolvase-like predicted endonuclease
LKSRGHIILDRNKEFFHTEVDIYFRSKTNELWFVEVKSRKSLEYLETAVSPRQRQRLRRVANALSDRGQAVKLILAVVEPRSGFIRWFPHFFD